MSNLSLAMFLILYRMGFNGKENDWEAKGWMNQQDYGMRIYDPRLGRFLSVDPLTKSYPELTPYQFASNRPIDGIDLDGLEYLSSYEAKSRFQQVYLNVTNSTNAKIESAQGELNLKNSSNRLKNYSNAHNNNLNNWADQNGNSSIGTKVTWLGAFLTPITTITEKAGIFQEQENLEKYAKSPLSQYGRGVVTTAPKPDQKGPATPTTTGGGKIGGAINVATIIAKYYGKTQTYFMNQEMKKANEEFKENGWRVLARLSYALEQNLIPGKYQNNYNITQIANYFLGGYEIGDTKLREFATKLWHQTDNLYYEEMGKERIKLTDGNSGNTGVAPNTIEVPVKIKKKI